ncbi:hypothetical protein F5Y16DRAFT_45195 [Xylariaceae sp. FL0255]|nr:hypothetical protein F5Y16DRAFT_45195 [Xylariaceae sp. FL0255]
MMPSVAGAHVPHISPPILTNDLILDDLSRQLAFPDSSRRIYRSSNGQRTPGAMRIVKPSSANNSPQNMMGRRKTIINNDNTVVRRRQVFDQALWQQIHETAPGYPTQQDPVKRASRPLSWHPSSHIPETQQMPMQLPHLDFAQYPILIPSPYNHKESFPSYQNLPPTPAVYSGHTSPVSSVSPVPLPYASTTSSAAVPAYVSTETWNSTPQATPGYFNRTSQETTGSFSDYCNQTSLHWSDYALQAPQSCTAPPTPEEFQTVPRAPSVPTEESISYQPLEEPEEEGEILVGMGLYDPPCKTDTDPSLNNYLTTTSQLLGSTYRTGKGWKLEEAWEPPATDDEGGDEDAESE